MTRYIKALQRVSFYFSEMKKRRGDEEEEEEEGKRKKIESE